MEERKVSVIIPVYNAEKYLQECLDSVINQTLKEIEIICIDDGSTDSSLQILQEYTLKNKFIKVLKQKNKGAGVARNLGIKIAQGEFVAFMDADDKYPNNDTLELLYTQAKENSVLVAGGEFSCFTNNCNIPSQNKTNWESKNSSLDGYLFAENKIINYQDYQFDYGYHRFIYNRIFLLENKIYYPKYKRFQDPPFFVEALFKAKKFYAINKITYAYRTGHTSVKWNTEKANHMLKGILDNMCYAHKNELHKLNEYSFIRLKQHYPQVRNLLNLKSLYIICKMKKYNSNITKFIQEKELDLCSFLCSKTLQSIFSIKNNNKKTHKIITILGVKIKIKRRNR